MKFIVKLLGPLAVILIIVLNIKKIFHTLGVMIFTIFRVIEGSIITIIFEKLPSGIRYFMGNNVLFYTLVVVTVVFLIMDLGYKYYEYLTSKKTFYIKTTVKNKGAVARKYAKRLLYSMLIPLVTILMQFGYTAWGNDIEEVKGGQLDVSLALLGGGNMERGYIVLGILFMLSFLILEFIEFRKSH